MIIHILRKSEHIEHRLHKGAMICSDLRTWLPNGIYFGRRVPWYPTRCVKHYVLRLKNGEKRIIPCCLVEGWNHCIIGYKIFIIPGFCQKIVEKIERIWEPRSVKAARIKKSKK